MDKPRREDFPEGPDGDTQFRDAMSRWYTLSQSEDATASQTDTDQQQRAKPQQQDATQPGAVQDSGTPLAEIRKARNTPAPDSPLYNPQDDYTADGNFQADANAQVPDWAKGEYSHWNDQVQKAWLDAYRNGDEVGFQEVRNYAREHPSEALRQEQPAAAAPVQAPATPEQPKPQADTSKPKPRANVAAPAKGPVTDYAKPDQPFGGNASKAPGVMSPNDPTPSGAISMQDILKRFRKQPTQ